MNRFLNALVLLLVSGFLPLAVPASAQSTKSAPSKARVVVLPVTYAQGERSAFVHDLMSRLGLTDPGVLQNMDLTQNLIDALVSTRKFDVLEREKVFKVIDELKLSESSLGQASNSVRMGKMLSADYLVMAEIVEFTVSREEERVPFVPTARQKLKAHAVVHVRVIETESGRIASSGQHETDYSETAPAPGASDPEVAFLRRVHARIAKEEANRLIDVCYPIAILSVRDSVLYLNRGQGGLEVGDRLDIVQAGQGLRDPVTGEDLGFEEIVIGQARVIDVKARVSEAVLEKSSGPIRAEQRLTCRKHPRGTAVVNGRTPPKID